MRQTKTERAIALRDMALAVIRERGGLERVPGPGGMTMQMASFCDGDLRMMHRTPFQRLSEEAPQYAKYLAAKKGRDHAGNLPYGLDVWRKGKVLNIEWADDGRVHVCCYKRGEWESDLEALTGAPSILPPVIAAHAEMLLTRDHGATLERREALARPNTFDPASRTIEAVIATSTPVTRRDARGEYDEVLDIAGADLDALRGAHVLDSHNQNGGVDAIIGVVQEAWREGENIVARMQLTARPEKAGQVRDIGAGIICNVSVAYEVAADAWRESEHNGRRVRTATKWRPREVSFVAVSADPNARTRGHDNGSGRAIINRQIRELGRRAGVAESVVNNLIDDEATVDHARSTILFEMVERSHPAIRPTVYGDDPATVQTRAIGDALYAKMTGTAPSGQARDLVHRSAIDLMGDHARACGIHLRSTNPVDVYNVVMNTRAAPGLHTTSDFPILLADQMNRRLGELFKALQSGASAIAAPGTARDFRPVSEGRLTSFPSLEPVNEAGEIKWGTLEEEGEALAIASFARAIGVTFQVLVNDNLGAVDRSIRDIAFATAQLKAKLVVAALSASLRDGKALFHADHGNLATPAGAAPDEATLSAGRIAMMKQKPPGSTEPLGISPSIFLVPAELQTGAEKLVAAINPASSDDVNVFSGKLQVAVEPRLPTAAQWFLFAAPGTYPVIRFLTLAGYDNPVFETSQEFSRLGTSYRVHWHVGAGPVDHRGAYKNPGAGG